MSHSPEPWSYTVRSREKKIVITDNSGAYVAEIAVSGVSLDQMEQNAMRIASCVNFCEGVSEGEMEVYSSLDDLLDASAQDELLLQDIDDLASVYDVQGIRQLIKNHRTNRAEATA